MLFVANIFYDNGLSPPEIVPWLTLHKVQNIPFFPLVGPGFHTYKRSQQLLRLCALLPGCIVQHGAGVPAGD